MPLKEKDDSLQTFIVHLQYTKNMNNIIFNLSVTHHFLLIMYQLYETSKIRYSSKKDLRQKRI